MSAEAHCKGCGKPMTEGRAYELGNHRWHMECFKCSKCDTQLTAMSNMLVLGDGRPVCTNCSYVCVSCKKRITDMAVLTSDLSFCASCFVCRNCKKRIDDLQYARTSQGIFCMVCHNALLARKKQRQLLRQQQQQPHSQTQSLTNSFNLEGRSSSTSPSTTPYYERELLISQQDLAGKRHSVATSTTSSSYDRNKDLPDLPPEIPPNSIDINVDFSGIGASRSTLDLASTSQTSLIKKDPRTLRVPRKQLAPSAFHGSDSSISLAPNESTPELDESVDKSLDKSVNSVDNSVDKSIDKSMDQSAGDLDYVVKQNVGHPMESHEIGPADVSETHLKSLDIAKTPVHTPVQTPTKKRDSEDQLNVPSRSQLRVSSPGSNYQPSEPDSASNSPSHRPPALALERFNLVSPTQAAAPAQTPKSPFNRWWHKRDNSNASATGSPSVLMPNSARSSPSNLYVDSPSATTPVSVHKRSLSETLTTITPNTRRSVENNDALADALRSLALERKRSSELESQLKDVQAKIKSREELNTEVHHLEIKLRHMRDEYEMWVRRIEQQKQQNRNSLPRDVRRDDQAPPQSRATEQQQPSQTYQQFQLQQGPGSGSGPTSQQQFLPLKNAKKWLFGRPNKPGQQNGGGNSNGLSNSSNNLYGLSGNGQAGNGQAGYSYNSNNYSTDLSGETVNIFANKQQNGNGAVNKRPVAETAALDSIIGEQLSYRVQIDQSAVPLFVTRCFKEIEERGLDAEGIYRKPGSKSQVDAILEQFGPHGDPAAGEELLLKSEIQAVSSAVKQYLRKLAEPVISYDCYDAYIAAGNSKNVMYLKKAVGALPVENQATLRAVIAHLALVATHQDINLMNIRNLAMVFAPTLAREESGDREVPDMQARNEATQMLITEFNVIFDPVDEIL